jgi:hypothetical protein
MNTRIWKVYLNLFFKNLRNTFTTLSMNKKTDLQILQRSVYLTILEKNELLPIRLEAGFLIFIASYLSDCLSWQSHSKIECEHMIQQQTIFYFTR